MNIKVNLAFAAVSITIIFLVLKVTEAINWSWWWVFSPLLIYIGLSVAVVLLALVIAGAITTTLINQAQKNGKTAKEAIEEIKKFNKK